MFWTFLDLLVMCYGFSAVTPPIPGGSLERFLASQRAGKAGASPEQQRLSPDNFNGFPALSAPFPSVMAGARAAEGVCKEGGTAGDGDGRIARIGVDPKKVRKKELY